MADKGGSKPPEDTEYGSPLPSDTTSLSDSDPEEVGLLDDTELDTLSPDEEEEEMVHHSLNDAEHPSLLGNTQKSAVQPFHLKGMSSTFSLRSQNIFDCLEGVAKRTVQSLSEDKVVDGRFKRPFPPAPILNKNTQGGVTQECKPPEAKSARTVPDYVAHPERWTRYSLEEVPESSDKTNRAVALEFLKDLKNRKGGEKGPAGQEGYTPSFNQDPSSCGAGRIIFAKPTKIGTSMIKKEEKKDDGENKSKFDKGDVSGKSPKRANAWKEEEEEEAGLGHIESQSGNELKSENVGIKETKVTDSGIQQIQEAQEKMSGTEFHNSKKKNRKHIRAKPDPEEGDSS
uniref:U5 small nuclear ribonucleoprotein TSSC4 n=1 Tax=Geotrypetes seraphini TaxID=260995 RepID=A0A6P8PKB0_GEOSA|nr:protein TSSC4 [Geotrypetes seraphini]XP_033784354.1 protein TSSC4 [Geotrypetes seraphini]XP_033784355.1 protein TSSC4 [Geotrypetes seraphini]XP_033784356.1 protein TSSC4 [Geotrypetes seraphini]XP_033784358.1 protein TSSC4 [Geotrypetes seraphini]XP_033784359.1 protein TSSC4 [Geotrypetes seraphini]XP_033784360.1 protein TSSC4 [Geotrypetes seraphini]XP_033784361.1 protein TSSC4 [Geotrypetes seraphini]XP_033784362.1 protein TSSC4 [Geotrypetes seraphini]